MAQVNNSNFKLLSSFNCFIKMKSSSQSDRLTLQLCLHSFTSVKPLPRGKLYQMEITNFNVEKYYDEMIIT